MMNRNKLFTNLAEQSGAIAGVADELLRRIVPQRTATAETMTRTLKLVPLLAVFLLLSCDSLDMILKGGSGPSHFVVKGVSGNDVLLDRLWDRGCIPGSNGNDWTAASRTLIGRELTFTLIDYQNGSPTPDCTNGRVGNATFTVTLTDDNILIPITWVDANGHPAAAPAGLEAVTEANGAEGLMTAATITPETQARADQLNQAMFCGFTDWAPNVGKDAVDCLTGGFNPFKATLVVDDRTMPWLIYDAVGMMIDANGYAIDMPNYLPHSGPFPIP